MNKCVVFALAFALLAFVVGPFASSPIPLFAQGPTATPATSAAPGVFVNSLRVQPAQPTFNSNVSFYPTFVNTADSTYTFKWLVYIYKADAPANSNNETSELLTHFAPGTAEYASLGNFKYGGTGRVCEYFFARVAWKDNNDLPVFFNKPDGSPLVQGFSVCDVSVVPTQVPPTAAPATPIPTPGPGLFVSNMRMQPEMPAFNQNTSFFPTFSNTTDQIMTFKWRVLIYKAGTPERTNSETTIIQSGFAPGTAETPALGTFHYGPTGASCENFTARVAWLDQNNQANYFVQPDGRVFEKPFSVCDVLLIPTSVPATPAPPTPVPTPGPGLFVTGMKLQPAESPQHNQMTTFVVSFNNNTSQVMTFNWRVFIYRVENTAVSNTETSLQQTGFQPGTADITALGSFHFGPTGNACDGFVARVGWLDNNNKASFFMMPDGRVFEKLFAVCN